MTNPRIQRAVPIGAAGGPLDSATERTLKSARGGGSALPGPMRATMESAFGADFSGIRVHADAGAAELNTSIQAKAFTVGNEIFFRDGLPHESSADGQHLLAHELTHTIQQGGSPSFNAARGASPNTALQPKLVVGSVAGPLEAEADRTADRVVAALREGTNGTNGTNEHHERIRRSKASPTSCGVPRIQRKAFVGPNYEEAGRSKNLQVNDLIQDDVTRRFKNQSELEKFGADRAAVDHIGITKDGDWVRVDEFTVLGETHSEPIAPAVINAIGTKRFRYEGFSHQSPTRVNASPALKAHTASRDKGRIEQLGLKPELVEGREHDAEHVLSKFARVLPDVANVAEQQTAGGGAQYVAAGRPWAEGYSLVKTLTKMLLDALIYVQSYDEKFFSHDLKTFYQANNDAVANSIKALKAAEADGVVPDFQRLAITERLGELGTTMTKLAKEKLGVSKDGALKKFIDEDLDTSHEMVVSITDDAKKNDYLRDLSMLKTIEEAKKAGDLLFVIGDAHRKKISRKFKATMEDKDFLKREKAKNEAARLAGHGINADDRQVLDSMRQGKYSEKMLNGKKGKALVGVREGDTVELPRTGTSLIEWVCNGGGSIDDRRNLTRGQGELKLALRFSSSDFVEDVNVKLP